MREHLAWIVLAAISLAAIASACGGSTPSGSGGAPGAGGAAVVQPKGDASAGDGGGESGW